MEILKGFVFDLQAHAAIPKTDGAAKVKTADGSWALVSATDAGGAFVAYWDGSGTYYVKTSNENYMAAEFEGTVVSASAIVVTVEDTVHTATPTVGTNAVFVKADASLTPSTAGGKITLDKTTVTGLSGTGNVALTGTLDFKDTSGTITTAEHGNMNLSGATAKITDAGVISDPTGGKFAGTITTSNGFAGSFMTTELEKSNTLGVTEDSNIGTVYTITGIDSGQTYTKIATGDTNWNITGTSWADTFETKDGGTGNITLDGGAGNDEITLKGNHFVSIDGGSGNDAITAKAKLRSGSTILGGSGKDVIDFSHKDAKDSSYLYIDGGDDDDEIKLGGTGDATHFGVSRSTIKGGAGRDTISSFDATNLLYGEGGADVFSLGNASISANIQDYAFGEDMFAVVGNDVVTTANGYGAKLRSDGNTGFIDKTGTDGAATITSGNGFFAVTMMDKIGSKANVGWVGDEATEIDASSQEIRNVIYGTTNTEGDTLIGGTKADTIYAGVNDSVYGGAGSDSIQIATNTTYGVYIGLSTGGGHDTVDNFTADWNIERADAVQMLDGTAEGLTVINNGAGREVSLKSGGATLTLNNAGNATEAKILISGKLIDAIAEGREAVVDNYSTIADYYIGTEASGINMEAYSGNVMVDLSNEMFRNINTLKAGTGDMSVLGGKAAESLIGGTGETSLYGGAGVDTMVSGAGKTTFFANESSDKDVVTGFVVGTGKNSDVINVSSLDRVSRADSRNFTVHLGINNDLRVAQASGDIDSNIQWASGEAAGVAKIGISDKDNVFSYDDATTNYFGGTKVDTVSVASGSSDSFTVWLDQTGDMFKSIEVYDFSQTTGNVLAAGKADTKETIVAGKGLSTLWGGAGNTADVLINKNSSAMVQFNYGLGDGNDLIQGHKDDTVKLYNLSLNDITKAVVDSNNVVITTTANESVTVSGGVETFTLSDGSIWKANYSKKSWS